VESVDALVVGAGVVGLAVARALAQRGREVVVVEAEAGIGRGVSARSSEVVHGGLYYPSGSLKARLRARSLVNSAGLGAPALAARISGVPAATLPRAYRCKGSYFALAGRAPFTRLIYPLPDAAGLGVHLTLDLAGQARFGPDTEWLADDAVEDLRVDPARGAAFAAAVRRCWPGLPAGALAPAPQAAPR